MGCVCSKARGQPSASATYCTLPEGSAQHTQLLEHVDLKKLTKLIKTGRLAPLYPHDVAQQDPAEECPICTVSYPSMNTASCCSARVCTECFVYHQTAADPPGKAQCPFCKSSPFAVRYLGTKPQEQVQQERAEQAIWARAKQRLRLQQDTPSAAAASTAAAPDTPSHSSQQQQQQEYDLAPQRQQQQQQQQQHRRQHSWLDDLSTPDGSPSSRRVEAISVFAGYHHRSSSSSGGADTGPLHDTTTSSSSSAAPAAAAAAGRPTVDLDSDTAAVLAAVAAAAEEEGEELFYDLDGAAGGTSVRQLLLLHQQHEQQQQLEQQQRREQQQREQQQRERQQQQLLELQLQQLQELQQLQQAGLLPGYAAAELSGLDLEELDEILLEQALMESMQGMPESTD